MAHRKKNHSNKLRFELLENRLLLICPPDCALDFGDAPDALGGPGGNPYPTLLQNDGARHIRGGPRLGARVDFEDTGQPNATATGDDVAFVATVFSDFNTANAVVIRFTAKQPGAAGNGIMVNVSKSAPGGPSGPPNISVNGNTIDIVLNPNAPTTNAQQLTDAINASTASALIDASIYQGASDADITAPTINYSPLVLDGGPDEDGVTFPAPFSSTAGTTGQVNVNVQNVPGVLNAWIDFNRDGDWNDGGEQIFADQTVNVGNNIVDFTVPQGAVAGTTFARFRLSTSTAPAILQPTGQAPDGEVEDYLVALVPSVTLSVAPATVAESGGISTITATLSGPSSQDVIVNLGFTGTATNGPDYISSAAQIVIIAGNTTGSATVTAQDDTLVEGDEQIVVDITNVLNGIEDGVQQQTVTITDADIATVSWQSAIAVVPEDGPPVNVIAVLATATGNTLANPAVFTVTATNGSAENADYDSGAFPATITFAPGSGRGDTGSTTFAPASDTLVEGDDTVTLTLVATTGAATVGAPATLDITITDADAATVSWQAATTALGEDAGNQNVTAVLTTAAGNTLETPAVFRVIAINGSAEDADYDSLAFPKLITFPATSGNGATQNATFAPVSDTLVEGGETVTLRLSPENAIATLGPLASDIVTITDADAATVSWQTATTAVGEDAITVIITAVLTTAPGNTLEIPAEFDVTATNGSAENADYDSISFPKRITFAAISSNGATQDITFNPISDTLVEGDETVTLTLTVNSGAATLGAQAADLVTIVDADAATVAWQPATTAVGEDATTLVTAVLTTALGNTLENPAVFNITATNGSAEDTDYDSISFPTTITFTALSGDGDTRETNFDPTSDTLVEGDETVTLTLTVNSGAATLGAQAANEVTIQDADVATVAWQAATTATGEDAAAANITAVLTTAIGDTLENPAVFNVAATNSTTENADYDSIAFPKTITFAALSGNGATQSTTLDPASDTVVEGDETLTLTLTFNSGVATLGIQAANVVTIQDADVATVAWQAATTAVGEDSAAANITAVLTTAPGNTLENPAVFNVTATNGTAENADYDSIAFPKTITFAALSGNGALQNTTLDPASDTLVEGDETVTLTLTFNSGLATVGAQATNVVTIQDSDAATMAWEHATTVIDEDAPAVTNRALLTTAVGNTLENPAVFNVTAINGSAENADYDSGAFPKTITFVAASGNGSTQIFTFDLISDTLIEGDETLTLVLTPNSGVVTLGVQSTRLVTIRDSDAARVSWLAATTAVGEDAATPNITAVLTTVIGNTLENPAVFNVTATNGSAENADYDSIAFPKTITFAAASGNGATQTTTLDPSSDTLVEGDDTVTLALAINSGVAILGAQATHVVTITDADTATVAWQLATSNVGRNAATLNVTAVLTTTIGSTLENSAVFNVSATNGSAENADYDSAAFPKTITFPAASGNGVTQDTTLDPVAAPPPVLSACDPSNTPGQGDETLTLTLAINSGVATLGAQTAHVVVITDAGFALSAGQNPTNRFDVNDNKTTDPLDALVVINSLNINGPRQLPILNVQPPYFDVNGDGFVSPVDPLAIFNVLNTQLPTGPEVNNGLLIDNDVAINAVGHFQVQPDSGGSIQLSGVTVQGRTQLAANSNFIFDFFNYIDPGRDGQAVNLANTTIATPATLVSPDVVASTGSFAGPNGTINWRAETRFNNGAAILCNTLTFDSIQPFGNVRYINYLDEDVLGTADDILFPNGTPGDSDFRAFTLDGPERFGFSHGGVYLPGPAMVNATYDGWAADEFRELNDIITGAGTNFSIPGNIDINSLPPFIDPALGQAFGPEDVTTAFAWTLDPNSTTATVTSFLELIGTVAVPPPAVLPPVVTPCDPSAIDLIIGGGNGNDNISVVPAAAGGVNVIFNGATSGPFAPAGRIVICGRGGDDTITVDANVNRSTFIFGGIGNDVLEGGSGDDVLVGGGGNDQLYGGLGRNVLISGTGTNVPPLPTDSKRLLGAIGDNLMIAGFTDFDTSSIALGEILDEWSRLDADYTTRVNHLRGVLPGGRNNANLLNANTVHNNGVRDDLFGCTGQNWYLAHTAGAAPLDTIVGRTAGELLDNLASGGGGGGGGGIGGGGVP